MRTGAGEVKARSGQALPRGQGVGDARLAATSTQRLYPGVGQPLNQSSVRSVNAMLSLTTSFAVQLTANPWIQSINSLNRICRTMYQLQLLSRNHVLIRNRIQVRSPPRLACQSVSHKGLSKNC